MGRLDVFGKCVDAECPNIGKGGTTGHKGKRCKKRRSKEDVCRVVPRGEEGARGEGAREKVEWSTMWLELRQFAFAL